MLLHSARSLHLFTTTFRRLPILLRTTQLSAHAPHISPPFHQQLFVRSLVMPPKASKRKVAADSDAEVSSHSESEQVAKKPAAKKSKAKAPVTPIDPSLPHNKEFPADLQPFPVKEEGSVRLSAWNVCGIKACDKKVRCAISGGEGARADPLLSIVGAAQVPASRGRRHPDPHRD